MDFGFGFQPDVAEQPSAAVVARWCFDIRYLILLVKRPSKNVSYLELVYPLCLHAVKSNQNTCGLQPTRLVTFVIRHRHFLLSMTQLVWIAVPIGLFGVSWRTTGERESRDLRALMQLDVPAIDVFVPVGTD